MAQMAHTSHAEMTFANVVNGLKYVMMALKLVRPSSVSEGKQLKA